MRSTTVMRTMRWIYEKKVVPMDRLKVLRACTFRVHHQPYAC